MRLNKYLAECGICSRRKADELILEGKVSINRKTVTTLGTDVDDKKDVVYVDGKKVVPVTHYEYYMFNKPKGCITTADDSGDIKNGREDKREENTVSKANSIAQQANQNASAETKKPRKTVYDYLDSSFKEKRLMPVGRLDYDSEGLLIFTNDGTLINKLTHPSNEIPKTYVVKIEGEIAESDLAILRKGVVVEGVKFGHSKVKVTAVEKGFTRLEVILFEGKNREIRRMFLAVEKNVVFLKRVALGDLRLGGLSRGGVRELSEAEAKYLMNL